jgi:excisionase family DNA binding protein
LFDLLSFFEASTGLLPFSAVRDALCVSDSTLRKMVAEKTIPSMLIGGQRKFCPATLHRWAVKRCPEMAKNRTVCQAKAWFPVGFHIRNGCRIT